MLFYRPRSSVEHHSAISGCRLHAKKNKYSITEDNTRNITASQTESLVPMGLLLSSSLTMQNTVVYVHIGTRIFRIDFLLLTPEEGFFKTFYSISSHITALSIFCTTGASCMPSACRYHSNTFKGFQPWDLKKNFRRDSHRPSATLPLFPRWRTLNPHSLT